MERWANKVALVTGAGSGIGAQIARDLCAKKVIVYGLDFTKDGLEKVSKDIAKDSEGRFTIIHCDLTKEEEIKAAFAKVISEKGGVDILVNCAGILGNATILEEGSDELVNKIIQTNLMAVISCIKKAYKSMCDRDSEGHIINLCSIAGHIPSSTGLPGMKPIGGSYTISKYGVNILSRALAKELVYYQKPKIRLSNISPGFVGETGIMNGAYFEGLASNPRAPKLKPQDISDTLMFILSAPSHVQIREVIIDAAGAGKY